MKSAKKWMSFKGCEFNRIASNIFSTSHCSWGIFFLMANNIPYNILINFSQGEFLKKIRNILEFPIYFAQVYSKIEYQNIYSKYFVWVLFHVFFIIFHEISYNQTVISFFRYSHYWFHWIFVSFFQFPS